MELMMKYRIKIVEKDGVTTFEPQFKRAFSIFWNPVPQSGSVSLRDDEGKPIPPCFITKRNGSVVLLCRTLKEAQGYIINHSEKQKPVVTLMSFDPTKEGKIEGVK